MRMLPRRPGAWLLCAGALVALPVACSQTPVEDGATRDEDDDEQTDDDMGEGGGRGGQPAGNAGMGGRGGASGGAGGSAGGAGGSRGGSGGSAGGGGTGEARDAGASVTPDASAPVAMSTLKDESIVWDGDGVGDGRARQWMGRGQEGKTTLAYSTASAKSPTHSIAFGVTNIQYGEFGWGIPATPANKYKYIAFWVNMVATPGKSAPGDAFVTVRVGGRYAAPGGGRGVRTITYNKQALRGGWNQVVIPVVDIVGSTGANIDELLVGVAGCGTERCGFTLYVDDIAFGN